MSDDPLATPLQFLKGAGARRAELLGKLGLKTVADLLFYLPRDVLDLTQVKPPAELTGERVETVRGRVVDRDARAISRGRTITGVLLDCSGEFVRGTWFNQPWMLRRFAPNAPVLFSGKPKRRDGRWEFSNPQVQYLVDDETADGGVQPRYSLTEGLTQEALRSLCRNAVEEFAGFLADPLPEDFRAELSVPHLSGAVRGLHLPESVAEFETAKRRVILDDLLEFQLGIALRRRAWKLDEAAARLPVTAKIDARIRRLFHFEFTAGQDRAVQEVARDLASGRAMHRLLQADVGAGKTVVAVYAMLTAVAHGYQAVLMAPTEVLADQHFRTLNAILKASRVERQLLTGRLTPARRKRLLARIASGDADIVIGTQALIQDAVRIPKLGVAVIDEQHKFGVAQRSVFSEGGGPDANAEAAALAEQPEAESQSATGDSGAVPAKPLRPHVLVMTATPIPRSLCLTTYGDLDLTAITDLPPGRQKVVTSRVRGAGGRAKAWEFIRKQLDTGRQAYVICPRVEENAEDLTAEVPGSVAAVFRTLTETELRDVPVGLVHGRMDADAKDAAMAAFRDDETAVLVSTTVVEVGVDVPNATLMVIYQPERFGLSQLHQLRGRIARGRHQGYCFLFTDSESDDASRRLAVLESTADGFKIAEADYEFRGPGDVLGLRQSGDTALRVADLQRDESLLVEARSVAMQLVESGRFDGPAFAPLKVRVLERFGGLTETPKTG